MGAVHLAFSFWERINQINHCLLTASSKCSFYVHMYTHMYIKTQAAKDLTTDVGFPESKAELKLNFPEPFPGANLQ